MEVLLGLKISNTPYDMNYLPDKSTLAISIAPVHPFFINAVTGAFRRQGFVRRISFSGIKIVKLYNFDTHGRIAGLCMMSK